MAVKRLSIIVVFLAAVIAIAALQYSRKIHSARRSAEDSRFARTYLELTLARETYASSPESLEAAFGRIFRANDCDSSWIYNHIRYIAADPDRYEKIWDEITGALDSLQKASGDTTAEN